MQHCRHCEGDEAEAHHGNEELTVAHLVGYPAAHHTRQHHAAQILEGRAEREDRGAAFPMGEADEIERIGRETQSVAHLLDEDASGNDGQALRLDETHIDIDNVG